MADEVVRKTELDELPSDRGQHAVPHEGERVPLRLGAEAGFSKDANGTKAYARAYAEAKDDGKFGRHLGHTIAVCLGSGLPGIAIAIVLQFGHAPAWLVAVGALTTMLVLGFVMMKRSREV